MAHARFRLLAAITVSGCTAPAPPATPPEPPPAVVVAEAPREPARGEPAAPEPAEPAMAEIREPDPAACRLSASHWDFRDLRLSVDGGRFASVTRAPGALVIPVTEKASSAVAAFDEGARLRLVARADDVALYMKGPRALLGIVTPSAGARLGLRSASPGALRIALDASELLVAPSPVEERVECSEIGLMPGDFDARASITKRKNLPKLFVAHHAAPIAARRGGEPAGSLVAGVEVRVLETRGTKARIVADALSFVVSGWVDRKDLTMTSTAGLGYGTGRGMYASKIRGNERLPSCREDLTLIGELGKERAIVGRIPAGTPYRLEEESSTADAPEHPKQELVPVELPRSSWLRLEKEARLLVKRSELAGCAEKTPAQ